MLRASFTPVLIVTITALTAIGLAACGSDDSSTEPPDGAAPAARPTAVFTGDTALKEQTTRSERTAPARLDNVAAVDAGSHSSVSFFFTNKVANYNVQYVDEPIACGSGAPLDIEGAMFLQVRLTPALAHNDLGEATFSLPDDISANLPAVVEIQQSCDFENELTYVLGLDAQADFRVGFLTAPLFNVEAIVLDIENP